MKTEKKSKGRKWAEQAALCQADVESVTEFADTYLYGNEVPPRGKLITAYNDVSSHYVDDSGDIKKPTKGDVQGDRIIHFTFLPCSKAATAVSFLIKEDGEVERAKHRKGRCPFRVYSYPQ